MIKKSGIISCIMTIALILILGGAGSVSLIGLKAYAAGDYTVIFDPEGGEVAPTEIIVTNGEKYGELPTPTRPGYVFQGWYTGSGGTETEITKDTDVNLETDIILYADWEPNYYNVTFDAQGGSTDVEQYTFAINLDSPYVLPEITPTRANYTFDGWYIDPDDDDTKVTPNTRVTTPADHTLYAKWIPDTYTVTFYFHDGNSSTEYASKPVSYGEPYGSLPVPERATYTFGGWYTSTYGGGTKITDTTLVTRASDHSLYTYWTRPKVTVTFDLQDGTGNTFTRELEVGGTYTIMDVPQRAGYIPQGWYTEPNGGGIEHNVFTVITSPTAYTLYAKWAPNTYTVNLDAQGGGGVAASLTRTFDSPYGPLPTPTRQHYIFDGWYTESGGNGTLVTDDTIVSTAYRHTLYAKWLGNPYTVTLYPQDGEFDVTTMTVRHGSPYNLPKPSRAHYVFTGWYTAPGSSGTLVTPETIVTATGDHALYARWIEAGVTVTLDYQGGEGGPTVLYRNLGDKYELPEPTRTGYEFYAWSTIPGLGGKYYRENSVVDNPNDHTLYAYWVRKVYAITFDAQGGTFTGTTVKLIPHGNTYDLPSPYKASYRFGGWWTEPNGRGTQIQGNMKPTGDQTLYAHWIYYTGYDYPPAPYIPPLPLPPSSSSPPSPPSPPPQPPVYTPMPPVTPGPSGNSAYIDIPSPPPPPPPPPPAPPVPEPPLFPDAGPPADSGDTSDTGTPSAAPSPPPPLPPTPPSLVVTSTMPDGSERILPGNYDPDTGRFSFLYDTLPGDTGGSTITTGYSTAAPSGVSEDHWAYQDASLLLSQGIIDGSKPVAPNNSMTRGDLIAMLYNTVAFPLDPGDDPKFSDTGGDDTAINWAAEKGIINGHPDGTCRPDAEISRQEAFVILGRFLEAYGIKPPDAGTGNAPPEFADADAIADWAFDYVGTLIRYGLVRGTPGDGGPEINPLSSISAAELISLIARILRLV
jgi:uncharacterized repeat protein (TIGR02543 family)